MQGAGNDYVYVAAIFQQIDNPGKLATRIGDVTQPLCGSVIEAIRSTPCMSIWPISRLMPDRNHAGRRVRAFGRGVFKAHGLLRSTNRL